MQLAGLSLHLETLFLFMIKHSYRLSLRVYTASNAGGRLKPHARAGAEHRHCDGLWDSRGHHCGYIVF